MIIEAFKKATLSAEFYLDAKALLREIELSKIQFNTLNLVDKFFAKYERMPSREELMLFFDELPEPERKFVPDYKAFVNEMYANDTAKGIDNKVMLAELKERVSKQRIKSKMVKIADTFDVKDATGIMKELQGLMFDNMEFIKDRKIEVDVTNLDRNIPLIKYKDTERIPTALTSLDRMLYGGVGVREFICFMAPSGRGKTTVLVNLYHGFLMQGFNVLYISLEMSVVDILRRLYRRILFKDKDFLKSDKDAEIREWLEKFFGLSKAQGRIAYFPANTFSTDQLKVELMKMEMRGDFFPHVIIIDHLDLMTSETKSIRQKESYSYWRLIVDDLREIPLTRGIPIITATQSNRDSSKKALVTDSDVGESYGKVQSSDVIISINQTPEELENKRMRLAVIKNRDYYKGAAIECFSDLDLMLVCDLLYAQQNSWL